LPKNREKVEKRRRFTDMERTLAKTLLVSMLFGLGLIMVVGCAKNVETTEVEETRTLPPKEEVPPPPPPPVAEEPKAPEIPPPPPVVKPTVKLEDVFFGFDKADLASNSRQAVEGVARWLEENADSRITVEGHCDERGTVEYNLALGERRATAIKEHLESLGVDSGRIKTISYGKERPFCSAHNEQCWQENRRGHFVEMTPGG
jgi:peptidoglycan-associated lipoprotein